jgi:hypothetical protein
MIAQAHAIISLLIHQFGRQFTLEIGTKQTPLQLINPVNQNADLRPCTRLGNGVHQTRRASKTFPFTVMFSAATALIFTNRLKTHVKIIGVQHGQAEICLRGPGP